MPTRFLFDVFGNYTIDLTYIRTLNNGFTQTSHYGGVRIKFPFVLVESTRKSYYH